MIRIRKKLFQWMVYILLLLMPITVYWPLTEPVTPGIYGMYVTPGVYLTDVVVLAVIILGVANIRTLQEQNPIIVVSRSQAYLTFPLFAICLFGVLTTPFALSPILAAYTSLRWLLAFCLFWVLIKSHVIFERAVLAFIAGLCIHVLVGLGQFLTRGPLGLPGELALQINQPGAARVTANGVQWLRAYGLTFHPNVLGGFLIVGMIMGLPLLKKPYLRLVWMILVAGLLLTFSRSAWLAAVVVLPIVIGWLLWKRNDLRRPIAVTLGVLVLLSAMGIVLLWNPIIRRLNPTSSFAEYTSLSGRGELMRIAIEAIKNHPFTGVGAGNFPLAVQSSESLVKPHYVHNVAMLLAGEVGVISGMSWLWLWIVPTAILERQLKKNPLWSIALVGAWFSIGIISLWDFYPWALESGRLLSVTILALTQQSLVFSATNTIA